MGNFSSTALGLGSNCWCCSWCCGGGGEKESGPASSNRHSQQRHHRETELPSTGPRRRRLALDPQRSSSTIVLIKATSSSSSSSSSGGGATSRVEKAVMMDGKENDGTRFAGYGWAIAGVALEQDAAYWEVHILSDNTEEGENETHGAARFKGAAAKDTKDTNSTSQGKDNPRGEVVSLARSEPSIEIWLGVTTAQNLRSLPDVDATDGGGSHDHEHPKEDPDTAAAFMLLRKMMVRPGDVMGLAVQQSDLPMVQFLHNGEMLPEQAIHRFRGTVYPAVYLPAQSSSSMSPVHLRWVFAEEDFQYMSPHARFGPVIVARGIL